MNRSEVSNSWLPMIGAAILGLVLGLTIGYVNDYLGFGLTQRELLFMVMWFAFIGFFVTIAIGAWRMSRQTGKR